MIAVIIQSAPAHSQAPALTPVEWIAILALLGVLIKVLDFFLKRHIKARDEREAAAIASMQALGNSVSLLDNTIRNLREEMLERFITKEDHRRDLELLKEGFGYGRRRTDAPCPYPECPHQA